MPGHRQGGSSASFADQATRAVRTLLSNPVVQAGLKHVLRLAMAQAIRAVQHQTRTRKRQMG